MFDFHFAYSDGNTYNVNNVSKIKIPSSSGTKEIKGDDILTAVLPLKSMCLYSDAGNVTISGTNLMVVDVLKRDE